MHTKPKARTLVLILLSISLLLGSILLIFCTPKNASLVDFSTSEGLDAFMLETTSLYGMDFINCSAFSSLPQGEKIVLLYASNVKVPDVRAYYVDNYDAIENGRNDDTSINLKMECPAGTITAINYYSAICQMYELTLYPTEEFSSELKQSFDEIFPQDVFDQLAIDYPNLLSGTEMGAYVRYTYDNLSPYFIENTPIYSCGSTFSGNKEDYISIVESMRTQWTQNTYDEAQNTFYFNRETDILGVSLQQTSDGAYLIAITSQDTSPS